MDENNDLSQVDVTAVGDPADPAAAIREGDLSLLFEGVQEGRPAKGTEDSFPGSEEEAVRIDPGQGFVDPNGDDSLVGEVDGLNMQSLPDDEVIATVSSRGRQRRPKRLPEYRYF